MTQLDVRPAGGGALIVTFATLPEVVAYRTGLASARLPGVVEVVSGARTLLVRYDPGLTDAARLGTGLTRVAPIGDGSVTDPDAPPVVVADVPLVIVPVVYDGADLDAVATVTGMTVAELVAWHTGQVWTSAFCGFAPGFSYLTGTATSLGLPRRDTARTTVPSGAVALAGEFSAVYPRASPGGWQLIGRTDLPMWSLDRDPPALAPAGTRVRFVDVGAAG